MSKRLGIVVALLLIAVLAAGCGGGAKQEAAGTQSSSSSSGSVQRIEVIAKEPFAYEPNVATVKRGTTVELVLKNEGALNHDIHIDEFNANSDLVGAGQSTTLTFTPNRTGEFKMYCAEPGHEAGGMVGTLKVID